MSHLQKHSKFYIIEYKIYIVLNEMPIWMATKKKKRTFEFFRWSEFRKPF